MEIPFTSMALLGINFDSLATLTATGQTHIRCLCIFVAHLRTCRAGKTGVRLQFHKVYGLQENCLKLLQDWVWRKSSPAWLRWWGRKQVKKIQCGSTFRSGEELIFFLEEIQTGWYSETAAPHLKPLHFGRSLIAIATKPQLTRRRAGVRKHHGQPGWRWRVQKASRR